jgi:hypothetical protein
VSCRKKRKAKEDKRDADEQGLVDGEEDMDAIDDDAAKVTISKSLADVANLPKFRPHKSKRTDRARKESL